MKVEGSFTFKAPPERVWQVLQDPEALRSCIPGCETLEASGPDEWRAALKVGVAGIRGSYTGRVQIADRNEPHSYRMSVEGTGGAGFVRGSGLISLTPKGEAETDVKVEGDAQVGGTIANVGQRLLGGAVKMLMGQFFGCLAKRLDGS